MTRVLDVIDFEKVNTLLEGFNQSTGFVTAILDLHGNILSKSGWRNICTQFHRENPETNHRCKISDTILASKLAKGEKYHFYQCLNGMVDVAVPIIIKNEHIANLFSGQFLFEKPNPEFFRMQSVRFGFDETAYMKALAEVPVISKEKVKTVMEFLLNMTQMISDITLQKMELIAAKEKAEESDRLKTAFLQNMSHEIRTPMNAIMGFSDLLTQNHYDHSKVVRYSEIINQRSKDLMNIINDVLDISKIESGQLTVQLEEVDPGRLFIELAEFFKEYKNRTGKNHIQFIIEPISDQKLNKIVTDSTKLKQILINLISNAFKFTEEGIITVGCRLNDGNKPEFFVSDTGLGIPVDKQEYIFERFTQLPQSPKKNTEGNGLGLAIVKALVNLLGGRIYLESATGTGSTFFITLPCEVLNSST